MSNIDLEQDDKATLEMLAMMGELPDDKPAQDTLDEALEVDALLDAINNASATENETSLEIDAEPPADDPEEAVDLDDIDAMLGGMNPVAEDTPATPAFDSTETDDNETTAEMPDDTLTDDTEPTDLADLDNAFDGLETQPEVPELADELPDELPDDSMNEDISAAMPDALSEEMADALHTQMPDELPDEVQDTAEDERLEDIPDALEEEPSLQADVADNAAAPLAGLSETAPLANAAEPDDNSARIVQQAADSIVNMEDAISIDQEIQKIAAEVTLSAQEATRLALATTRKAHASAEKTQQAIEATFAAAERAFEAAKQAGYDLQNDGLGELLSSEAIDAQLAGIREKNAQLKAVNASIKQRIAELKTQ